MEKVNNFLNHVLPKILSVILVFLIFTSMIDSNLIQGCARVVNYTASVRGGSQRIVKLVIMGQPYSDLINESEIILNELKKGGKIHNLVPLQSVQYQKDLAIMTQYWYALKQELAKVNVYGWENTDILTVSERFFELANTTVSSAETYSDELAKDLLRVEYAMAVTSLLLIALLLFNSFQNRRLSNKNSELSHTAYLDKHTGLPNKSRCEEMLNSSQPLDDQTACLMFDLNNLKKINDALGHQAGDQMISGFAHLLRKAVPIYDFVGRYGGDEFVAILTNVSPEDVQRFLEKLKRMTEEYNRSGTQLLPVIPLSYAAGYAHSANVENNTMPALLRLAETTKQASPATYEIQQDGSQYFIATASKRLYVDYDSTKDVLSISSLGDYLRN